jgi:GTPase SAR1 family protein
MAATTLDNGPIDSKYKILLVGDSDVGKTDILNKYIEEGAPGCIDYKTHTIEHDSKRIQLQIWDTQGQERWEDYFSMFLPCDCLRSNIMLILSSPLFLCYDRFRAITSSYYRGAHGAMIVFDVINRDSYEHIEDWFKDIERYCEPNVSKV